MRLGTWDRYRRMNAVPTPERSARTVILFVILFAIGSIYLASLAYFLMHGTNFINKEKITAAILFSKSQTLTLPATLNFTKQSKWSRSLAIGWNFPENWGVWSSSSYATIILPAIQNEQRSICVAARVGTMSETQHWPMTVTVNGHVLEHRQQFSGTGPFVIRGIVPASARKLIYLTFAGPNPKIPNVVSQHTTDARSLGFSLFQISIASQCNSR